VTIFSMPPPASSLYFTSAMSGSMPVVSAVHQEADRAGGREHGDLRIAVAVLFAQGECAIQAFCASS